MADNFAAQDFSSYIPEGAAVSTLSSAPPRSLVRKSHDELHVSGTNTNPKMPNLGILNRFVADDTIQEILVNGLSAIYIDRGGELVDAGSRFSNHEELAEAASAIMQAVGQYWDKDRPLLDTRLPDGSRVNLVGPPMAVDGISISIRKFPTHNFTLEHMVELKQFTPQIVQFLKAVVAGRLNILVAGGTSSGKTTVMNALSAAIGARERIVTVEDSAELRLQQPHVVRLEAKPAMTTQGQETAVTIRDLVKNALRMRPDRIIVGESRGAEAFDMLQAMNTGHDGSMTTLHANTPRDALARLETMVTLAVPLMPSRLIRAQIASSVNLIIQMNRTKNGDRRMTHISEVAGMEGENITMQDLLVFTEPTPTQPGGYKWVAGSSRNAVVTDAARAAGFLQGMR